jgi:phosphoenolpyruvate synthase/pyruvate phosphate dikinase
MVQWPWVLTAVFWLTEKTEKRKEERTEGEKKGKREEKGTRSNHQRKEPVCRPARTLLAREFYCFQYDFFRK